MKSLRCVLMIAVLSLPAACGGGGSGSSGNAETDFASITVDGAGKVLYTEAASTQSPSGYSPYLFVMSSATPSIGTYLYSLDWDGSAYVTRFEIHVWGSGPGTYHIADNSLVYFNPAIGSVYSAVTNSLTSGTITFTELGAPGEKVKGTFDVTSLLVSSPSQTGHLTGSFSVTRE